MLRNLLTIVCLLALTGSAYGQKKKKGPGTAPIAAEQQATDYKKIGTPLPELKIYRRDGRYLTHESLNNGSPLIIMLFNPTCDHCEEQARTFGQYNDQFRKTNLVLVAAEGMGPYISYFVNNARADNYPALQIGLDSSGYIKKTFRYESLPQINVYDKERKLVKVFVGPTPIDSLKAYIE